MGHSYTSSRKEERVAQRESSARYLRRRKRETQEARRSSSFAILFLLASTVIKITSELFEEQKNAAYLLINQPVAQCNTRARVQIMQIQYDACAYIRLRIHTYTLWIRCTYGKFRVNVHKSEAYGYLRKRDVWPDESQVYSRMIFARESL